MRYLIMRLKDILEIFDNNKKMEHYLLVIKVNNINTHIFYGHEIKKFYNCLPVTLLNKKVDYNNNYNNNNTDIAIINVLK